jgi:hypothetical protein
VSRTVSLNALTEGITRLRNKGGASPQALFDLENGYVTQSGAIASRPGTVDDAELPAGTKGLMAHDGAMLVFSNAVKSCPAGYSCEVLTHPDNPDIEIAYIHFAKPFLGYPYVVAEFATGDVYHYWLQSGTSWSADTAFSEGDVIVPTTPNGLAYRAKRPAAPGIPWAPNVARTVGDKVEPTVANGFEYTVIDTIGDNPQSGATEPTWPTEDGATINEDADLVVATSTTSEDTTPLPGSVKDRYGNPKNPLEEPL